MRLSFEPIGPEFRESLKEHLAPFGLPGHIVEWKYFQRPPSDVLSGLVWLKNGKVRGTIGLIPFQIGIGGRRVSAAWTCDWVVDSPQANPGIGVMLFQRAKALAGPLFSLGGNELNRRLMSRIANATFESAGIELYLPLRIGGTSRFRGLNRRSGGLFGPARRLPIRRSLESGVKVVQGVDPAIVSMLDSSGSERSVPVYTLDQLRWQLEGCPDVSSITVLARSSRGAAGALCWSRTTVAADWRCALWTAGDDDEAARDVVEAMAAYVDSRGGERLCILASRADTARLELLRRLRFLSDEPDRPLFVTGDAIEPADQLTGLSFVDTDLAYRV